MERETETKSADSLEMSSLFRRIIIESKVRRKNKQDLLLRLLTRSRMALTEDDRARIEECSEESLDRWIAEVQGKAFEQDFIERGICEGKRDALLRLAARAEVPLTEDDRARVLACTDGATLDRWLDNVLGAKSASDIFT